MEKESVDFLFDAEEKAHLEEVAIDLDKKGLEYFEQSRTEEAEFVEAARQTLLKKEENVAAAKEKEAKAVEKEEAAIVVLDEAEAKLANTPINTPAYRKMVTRVEEARSKLAASREKVQQAQAFLAKKEKLAEKARNSARSVVAMANQSLRAAGYFLDIPEHEIPVYYIEDVA